MNGPALRVGTRGSPLARHQAQLACAALAAARPALAEPGALDVIAIRTSGDRITDRPLADVGGKGLFCKELEAALADRRIDIAVHSVKDLPTWLPEGLVLDAVLPREDPRDALISRGAGSLDALPRSAVVGTASVRRQAQLLARRPDLKVTFLRGNVHTRLRKLEAGEADATLLALAGLKRLGLERAASAILEPETFLPAVGQGAIGLECREDDTSTRALLAQVNHTESSLCIEAERALLDVLEGSCRTPIAGYATLVAGDRLRLRALIARPDGSESLRIERSGPAAERIALGREAGSALRVRAGPGFFD